MIITKFYYSLKTRLLCKKHIRVKRDDEIYFLKLFNYSNYRLLDENNILEVELVKSF
jgi:hypothetical protein